MSNELITAEDDLAKVRVTFHLNDDSDTFIKGFYRLHNFIRTEADIEREVTFQQTDLGKLMSSLTQHTERCNFSESSHSETYDMSTYEFLNRVASYHQPLSDNITSVHIEHKIFPSYRGGIEAKDFNAEGLAGNTPEKLLERLLRDSPTEETLRVCAGWSNNNPNTTSTLIDIRQFHLNLLGFKPLLTTTSLSQYWYGIEPRLNARKLFFNAEKGIDFFLANFMKMILFNL